MSDIRAPGLPAGIRQEAPWQRISHRVIPELHIQDFMALYIWHKCRSVPSMFT